MSATEVELLLQGPAEHQTLGLMTRLVHFEGAIVLDFRVSLIYVIVEVFTFFSLSRDRPLTNVDAARQK